MALLDIVLYPDPPLSEKAEPFDTIGPDAARLAADMFETMTEYDGCGLAGPQVGVTKCILVLRDPESGTEMCLINPEIYEAEGRESGEEGCLSFPHVYAMVPRARRIRVRAFNERGDPLDFEATDYVARIIQHETDHLSGVVFVDRLDLLTREAKTREWAEVREQIFSAIGGQ